MLAFLDSILSALAGFASYCKLLLDIQAFGGNLLLTKHF